MRKINVFNTILELIVILGNIVIGVTVLTYIYQHEYYNKILLALIILAVGLIGLTEFFTLKFVLRIRSIQNAVGSVLLIGLGLIFLFAKLEMKQICLIWGISNIVLASIHVTTSVLNILRKPLINGVRIILNICLVVFSIFLMVKTIDYLNSFLVFVGVALLVEAAILMIEFIIARYQE